MVPGVAELGGEIGGGLDRARDGLDMLAIAGYVRVAVW